jgi:outer membrane protein TolC
MLKKIIKLTLIISLGALISCAKRSPEPLTVDVISKSVKGDLAKIEEVKEQNDLLKQGLKIDLYTAIALAVENNKDLKVKIFETALSNKKIQDVEFDMLPAMSANAGYTGSDRYKATTSATVPSNDRAGSMGSSYSTSRDREVNEQDIGFSWNVLDFGLSYIRAGQSSDRYLISRELERKTASNIKRDVVRAYWNALSADKLIKRYDPLLVKVNKALNDSQKIQELLLQKPMDALLYQKELLDIQRALLTQKQSFVNAKIELKSLMGLLPNEKFTLVETDLPLNELNMTLDDMENYALVNRSELMENRYEERISIAETKAGIRSLLPGLNFNASWTSSSNDYLMNKTNFEYGSSIGANLFNVFRAPIIRELNERNTEIIKEQRLALSMAVLSQVHISNIEYQMALEEYETAERYYEVSRKITEQVRNAQKIARFGELELIREEASLLVAELRRDIAYSRVQFSIAQVYTSVGIDVTHLESNRRSDIGTQEYAQIIRNNFKFSGEKYKLDLSTDGINVNKNRRIVDRDIGKPKTKEEKKLAREQKKRAKEEAKKAKKLAKEQKKQARLKAKQDEKLAKEKAIRDKKLALQQKKQARLKAKQDKKLALEKAKRDKKLALQQKKQARLKAEQDKKLALEKAKRDKKLALQQKKQARLKAEQDKKLALEKAKRDKKLALQQKKQARLKAEQDKKLALEKAKRDKKLALQQKKQARLKAEQDKKLAKEKATKDKKQARLKAEQDAKLAKEKAIRDKKLAIEKRKQARLKAEREKKQAKEKAIKDKKLARLKAAEEKKLAKEKAKREKKLAKEKAKRAKKLAEEQKKLAKVKAKEAKKIAKLKAKQAKKLAKEKKKLAKQKAKEAKKLAKQKAKEEKRLKKLKEKEEKRLKKLKKKNKS